MYNERQKNSPVVNLRQCQTTLFCQFLLLVFRRIRMLHTCTQLNPCIQSINQLFY